MEKKRFQKRRNIRGNDIVAGIIVSVLLGVLITGITFFLVLHSEWGYGWEFFPSRYSFNWFVRRRKRYDRNRLFPVVQDKFRVRNYARSVGATEFIRLPVLYASSSDPDKIQWSALPTPCVIKSNHSCATMLAVGVESETTSSSRARVAASTAAATAAAVVSSELPTLPSAALHDPQVVSRIKTRCNQWLKQQYGNDWRFRYIIGREWAYSEIPSLIMVEEYLGLFPVISARRARQIHQTIMQRQRQRRRQTNRARRQSTQRLSGKVSNVSSVFRHARTERARVRQLLLIANMSSAIRDQAFNQHFCPVGNMWELNLYTFGGIIALVRVKYKIHTWSTTTVMNSSAAAAACVAKPSVRPSSSSSSHVIGSGIDSRIFHGVYVTSSSSSSSSSRASSSSRDALGQQSTQGGKINDSQEEWTFIPQAHMHYRNAVPAPFAFDQPANWDRVRKGAYCLGKPFDFIRIDLYCIRPFSPDPDYVLGEMTVYPAGGRTRWIPTSIETMLGDAWCRALTPDSAQRLRLNFPLSSSAE